MNAGSCCLPDYLNVFFTLPTFVLLMTYYPFARKRDALC